MFCANCGTKNDDANRFCSHCGRALTAPQASQAPSTQTGKPVHPPNAPTHSSASLLSNLPPYLSLVFAALGGGMVGLVLLAIIVYVVLKPNPPSTDITTAAVLATPILSQTPIAGQVSPTTEAIAQSPLLPSPTPSPLPTRAASPTAVPLTPTLKPFTGNSLEMIIQSLQAQAQVKSYRIRETLIYSNTPSTTIREVLLPERYRVLNTDGTARAVCIAGKNYRKTKDGPWQADKTECQTELDIFTNMNQPAFQDQHRRYSADVKYVGAEFIENTATWHFQYKDTLVNFSHDIWIAIVDGLPRKTEDHALNFFSTINIFYDYNVALTIESPIGADPAPLILPPELIKAVEVALTQRWRGGGRAVRNVTVERKAADQDGLTGRAFFEMQNAVIGTSPIWIKFSSDFRAVRTTQGQWDVSFDPFVGMVDYASGSAFQVVPNLDPELTQSLERSVISFATQQDMSARNIRIQRISGDETSVRMRVLFEMRDAMGSSVGWDDLQWEAEAKKQNGSWDFNWLTRSPTMR
jgi:hypothetical protein